MPAFLRLRLEASLGYIAKPCQPSLQKSHIVEENWQKFKAKEEREQNISGTVT